MTIKEIATISVFFVVFITLISIGVLIWNLIKLICIKYQLQKYIEWSNIGMIGWSIDYQYQKK